MSASGVRNLVIIDGIIDQYLYLDVLKNYLKSSVDKLCLGYFSTRQLFKTRGKTG